MKRTLKGLSIGIVLLGCYFVGLGVYRIVDGVQAYLADMNAKVERVEDAVEEIIEDNLFDELEERSDFSGTYRLRASDDFGSWSGTATPIKCVEVDGLWHVTFLTAGHCISDNPAALYSIDSGPDTQAIGAGAGGSKHPGGVDVGVVQVVCFRPIEVREVSFRELEYGETVFVCGFPAGAGPYLTQGYYTDDGRISASGFPGSSGSAVCDVDGNVVGVLVAGYSSGFQFIDFAVLCVPTADVRTWLAGQL